MATSSFTKFSLLTIAVVLSSYVCSTEAVTACPIPAAPDSVQLLTAYNCTVQRCATALSSCSGINCSRGNPVLVFLQVDLYIAVSNLIGTCTACSVAIVNAIAAILLLIAILFTELLIVLQLAVVTIIIVVTRCAVIIAQITICVGLLNIIGTVLSGIVITVIYALRDLCINVMLACI